MRKFIVPVCLLPVAFQLFLIVNSVYAYAHTHSNQNLTREEKIVAITILAEARGEGEAGMYAVGAVIAQRAFEGKRTPSEVCLKKWQFSCWNGKKPKDLAHLLKTPQAKYALLIAKISITCHASLLVMQTITIIIK